MLNSASGIRMIVAKPLGAGTANSYGLWVDNGTLTAKVERVGTVPVPLTKAFAPVLGRWYHVGYTFRRHHEATGALSRRRTGRSGSREHLHRLR